MAHGHGRCNTSSFRIDHGTLSRCWNNVDMIRTHSRGQIQGIRALQAHAFSNPWNTTSCRVVRLVTEAFGNTASKRSSPVDRLF
eukprot:141366-Pleurochrysis_carterae.AAC.2